MAGLTVDQILEKISRSKTAEETLIEGLSEMEPVEEAENDEELEEEEDTSSDDQDTEEYSAATKQASKNKTVTNKVAGISDEDLEQIKQAEEIGKIMARAFVEELELISNSAYAQTKEADDEDSSEIDEELLQKQAEVLINLYNKFNGGK